MRWLGGIPVNLYESRNVVQQMIDAFNSNDELIVVISPEANRAYVEKWKSGFYHIAVGAGLPIVLGFLDFARREGGYLNTFLPSGELERDLAALAGAHVLAVGDVMLDRYVYGTVERISPEGPIPVLRVGREATMLGGAGNVLRNLAALGLRTRFLSVIGEDAAAGLALRAVVRLVLRVDDALHGRAAVGAGLVVPAVHGHVGPERGDLVGPPVARLLDQLVSPLSQGRNRCLEQALHFLGRQRRRALDRRDLGGVEDLVRVGVADPAEDLLVRDGALQSSVLPPNRFGEVVETDFERFEPAAIVLSQGLLAPHDVEGRSLLRRCLGQQERAIDEVETGMGSLLRNGGPR